MSDFTDEQFEAMLRRAVSALGDHSPGTRAFASSLLARQEGVAQGGPGVTPETLAADLIGALAWIEERLTALEGGR